jgi:hypothetical protein
MAACGAVPSFGDDTGEDRAAASRPSPARTRGGWSPGGLARSTRPPRPPLRQHVGPDEQAAVGEGGVGREDLQGRGGDRVPDAHRGLRRPAPRVSAGGAARSPLPGGRSASAGRTRGPARSGRIAPAPPAGRAWRRRCSRTSRWRRRRTSGRRSGCRAWSARQRRPSPSPGVHRVSGGDDAGFEGGDGRDQLERRARLDLVGDGVVAPGGLREGAGAVGVVVRRVGQREDRRRSRGPSRAPCPTAPRPRSTPRTSSSWRMDWRTRSMVRTSSCPCSGSIDECRRRRGGRRRVGRAGRPAGRRRRGGRRRTGARCRRCPRRSGPRGR